MLSQSGLSSELLHSSKCNPRQLSLTATGTLADNKLLKMYKRTMQTDLIRYLDVVPQTLLPSAMPYTGPMPSTCISEPLLLGCHAAILSCRGH